MTKTKPANGIREGTVFGRLTALQESTPRHYWIFRCSCGTVTTVYKYSVLRGLTTSCGCYRRAFRRTHGMCGRPEYKIWNAMISRCTQPRRTGFNLYGGRGIRVAPAWRNFATFFADVGTRPSSRHSLERIDNSGDYEPGNVRWATPPEQNRNMRRNRWVEFQGERLILADWALRLGVTWGTLRKRLERWPLERALTEPPRH